MNLRQLNLKPGKAPPVFSAATLDGEQVSLNDFEGQVVLLDFWATWCAPCIVELPNLQRIYREHHEAGFEIVSISLDQEKQVLERFLDQREMPWTHVFNAAMPGGEDLASAYGVKAIPQMVLVGRDGKIAAVNARGPALEAAVEEALREERAEPASSSEPSEHEPQPGDDI